MEEGILAVFMGWCYSMIHFVAVMFFKERARMLAHVVTGVTLGGALFYFFGWYSVLTAIVFIVCVEITMSWLMGNSTNK